MPIAPPSYVIYWSGATYKTPMSLVNKISGSEHYVFLSRRTPVSVNLEGPMGVYFADNRPALDLVPIFMPVLLDLAVARPDCQPGGFPLQGEEKALLDAWKKNLRTELRAAFEASCTVPYRG